MTSAQPKSAGELDSRVAELYARSKAADYGITAEDFSRILSAIADKYAPGASRAQMADFMASLRIEELALARGCAAGNEKAWEIFLTRFREKLYSAAHGMVRDDATARELADGLYADLYGTRITDGGKRVSKLESYTGRGSLEGWLRTVLAQEYVNRYRSGRRNVSLEEQEEDGHQFVSPEPIQQPAPDSRLIAAIDQALASLSAEDRFILASYYLDGRTLAEIAKMLSVHESTISRKVEKIAAGLRKRIIEGLVYRGMSRRQADEALDVDVRDVSVDIRGRLAQEPRGQPFFKKEAE